MYRIANSYKHIIKIHCGPDAGAHVCGGVGFIEKENTSPAVQGPEERSRRTGLETCCQIV